jgi:hypothetical protein
MNHNRLKSGASNRRKTIVIPQAEKLSVMNLRNAYIAVKLDAT